MAASAENEIVVVDNGSTDGSAEFLRDNFHCAVLALLQIWDSAADRTPVLQQRRTTL